LNRIVNAAAYDVRPFDNLIREISYSVYAQVLDRRVEKPIRIIPDSSFNFELATPPSKNRGEAKILLTIKNEVPANKQAKTGLSLKEQENCQYALAFVVREVNRGFDLGFPSFLYNVEQFLIT